MRRTIVGLAAAAIATALIFGPGRSLLPGSTRVQLPDVSQAAPAPARPDAGPAASAAPAVVAPGANSARLTLTAQPAQKLTQGYVLAVHVTAPDGKPVNETGVTFYETVELFGRREMHVGGASTDAQGDTSLIYLPARLGAHEIVARSNTKGQVRGGEARLTFDAQVAAPAYRVAAPPLAAFTALVPYGVGAIVVSVWLLLAFALFGTARGVVGGARDHAREKGDIA